MRGFTLIELLISIAVVSVLTSSVVIAVNPTKRLKQERDVQRKADIDSIMFALEVYESNNDGLYPDDMVCDTSIGSANTSCTTYQSGSPLYSWDPNSGIYQQLVGKGSLKTLPLDPINGQKDGTWYYFRYELRKLGGACFPNNLGCQYWIGTKLEAPADPSKPIYRCTDYVALSAGVGCKEVAGPDINSLIR